MKRETRRSAIVITIAATILLVIAYLVVEYGRHNAPAKIGEMAPNIQAETVNGQSFSLASLRGKPVLLNFFTPWCQPCIEETPDLISFAQQYGQDVHVVMIDRGDGTALVQQYVAKYHLPNRITVLLSPQDKWSPRFGVTGQPETFFISADGKVRLHLIGPLTETQMVAYAKMVGLRAG